MYESFFSRRNHCFIDTSNLNLPEIAFVFSQDRKQIHTESVVPDWAQGLTLITHSTIKDINTKGS